MANLAQPLILGRDFLNDHQAILDYGAHTLTLSPKVRIEAANTFLVPPHSECVISAKLSTNVPNGVVGITQCNRTMLSLNLIGACALVSSDCHTVPVRFLNPSSTSCTVYKKTCLGSFEALTPQDSVAVVVQDSSAQSIGTHGTRNHPGTIYDSTQPKSTAYDSQSDQSPRSSQATANASPFSPSPDNQLVRQPTQHNISQLVDLSKADLTEAQKAELCNLIDSHVDAFATSLSELGCTDIVEHVIETEPDAKPFRSVPYRVNPTDKRLIDNHINELLDAKIIRESKSSWSSPIVLVRRPGSDKTRMAIDYRKLNSITKVDSQPLPRLDDCLDSIGESQPQFFTCLDILSGYMQIKMAPCSIEKTAITSHRGTYEYLRMPFGLVNGTQCFTRLMQNVLRSLLWSTCLIYVDDCIIFSKTWDLHKQHIAQVLDRFRAAGLKARLSKSTFAAAEVKYVGHIVNKFGIKPDPDKVNAVKQFPAPTDLKSLRQFLGLSNFFRKFIQGFATLAEPLTVLTRSDTPFHWTADCDRSFNQIKDLLCSDTVLAYPDWNLPFILDCDASEKSIGYILSQRQDGVVRPIAYGGRKLHSYEQRYENHEREALAVVAGLKHHF